jgi:hypothetical protein
MGGHSPANIMHHLKGIHFPVQKRELVQQAKRNGTEEDIMEILNDIPDQGFASIAEVLKAVGGAGRNPEQG